MTKGGGVQKNTNEYMSVVKAEFCVYGCISSCMFRHPCVKVHVHLCICTYRGQRSVFYCSLGFIHTSFETRSLTTLQPAQQAILVGHSAPGILLSLPSHFWDYKCVSLFLAFYMHAKDWVFTLVEQAHYQLAYLPSLRAGLLMVYASNDNISFFFFCVFWRQDVCLPVFSSLLKY